MIDDNSAHKQLAVQVANKVSYEDRTVLMEWLQGLLNINKSNLTRLQRATKAIALTIKSRVVLMAVKSIYREMKRHMWDNRSHSIRFGLGGAALGLTVFGGHTAGIAALGTAIAVPLWIVLGAGATFAHTLYDELLRKSKAADDATYTIIEAVKDDGPW